MSRGLLEQPDANASSSPTAGCIPRCGADRRRRFLHHRRPLEGHVHFRRAKMSYPAEGGERSAPARAIAEAAVIGIPSEQWGEKPAWRSCRQAGTLITEAEIQAHCEATWRASTASRHPVCRCLPRNATGKIHSRPCARISVRPKPSIRRARSRLPRAFRSGRIMIANPWPRGSRRAALPRSSP